MLQSAIFYSLNCSVILFHAKGIILFIPTEGIAFSVILIFITMPGLVNPGGSYFLRVFVLRSKGMGWLEGEPLRAYNKEKDTAIC